MKIVENIGCKKAFLSGGPTLNTSFAKEGLIDEIILNYNPTILSDGIKVFAEDDFELNLKLQGMRQISSDIVQARYLVL